MNERIRELHNRACRLDMEQYPNAIPDGERIQQKFAELIVRECAITVIDGCEMRNAEDVKRAEYHAKRIKQHFGVEL